MDTATTTAAAPTVAALATTETKVKGLLSALIAEIDAVPGEISEFW
jgi:hypothetical protein